MRALSLLIAIAALGCSERDPRPAAVNAGLVLSAAPAPKHKLDVAFEERVELIGYDLDSAQLTPDKPFEITWYWRVKAPLGDGVQVFTHVVDANGATRLNLDAQRALREKYPEAKWRAGDLIKDTQRSSLPADWSSPLAAFHLGFYKGDQRIAIKRGEHDSESRAIGARIPVAVAPPPVPSSKRRA